MSHCRQSSMAMALAMLVASAQATTINLSSDNTWNAFTVDSLSSNSGGNEWIDADFSNSATFGSALNYTFTIALGSVGTLTVVDAGFAGDTFSVLNNGVALGVTSNVPVQTYSATMPSVADFDAALASSGFSRGVYTLSAGAYNIIGALLQSVLASGSPLNATGGAVKLGVSAVPEPSGWALGCVGPFGLIVLISRRALTNTASNRKTL